MLPAVPGKSAEHCSFFLLGKKLGYTFNNRNFHNVSLGQGQEVVAEQALDLAAKEGHWVILQVGCLWKQSCRSPGLPDADHLSKGSLLFLCGGRWDKVSSVGPKQPPSCCYLLLLLGIVILVFLLFEPSVGCVVVGSPLREGCATLPVLLFAS